MHVGAHVFGVLDEGRVGVDAVQQVFLLFQAGQLESRGLQLLRGFVQVRLRVHFFRTFGGFTQVALLSV